MKASRWINLLVLLVLVVAMLPAPKPALAAPLMQDIPADAAYVPGEVLVSFDANLKPKQYAAQASALAGEVGAQVAAQYGNMALLSFDPETDVPATVESLAGAGYFAQPNYVYALADNYATSAAIEPGDSYILPTGEDGSKIAIPWDQLLAMRARQTKGTRVLATAVAFPNEMPNQWGWQQVKADMIYSNIAVSPAVCLLDTGVDDLHPDLKGKITKGLDFVNSDAVPNDDNGHGTFLAGVIGATGNNGATTAVGVANAKILAVKVLNAQGLGTSYTLAAGINYCAKNATVKVINISVGMSTADARVYDQLHYAITPGYTPAGSAAITVKKFVVTAAGNETSSAPLYPAAWADVNNTAPGGGANAISTGMVAVGAAAPPSFNYFVDVDGDGSINPDGSEWFKNCAAYYEPTNGGDKGGSNYGSWVEIVAPGQSVTSATPVSYPFWRNYAHGTAAGYATLSGSSIAAAFVSGGVARMLSVYTTRTNATTPSIKEGLLDESDSLDELGLLASDQVATGLVPTTGFNQPGLGTDPYGWYESGGPNDEAYIWAPFCWPNDGGLFEAAQDMTSSRYLNVAGVMGRGGAIAYVYDAGTGLPLVKGTVKASEQVGTALTLRNTVTITSTTSPLVLIPNLPTTAENPYSFLVNAAKFTMGDVKFNYDVEVQPGKYNESPYNNVGVPQTGVNAIVLDWNNLDTDGDGVKDPINLDLLVFTPTGAAAGARGVVNQGTLFVDPDGAASTYTGGTINANIDLFMGTLLAPASWGGVGTVSPYIQHMRESANDGIPMESVFLRLPTTAGMAAGTYTFVVTDYSSDYSGASCPDGYVGCQQKRFDSGDGDNFVSPIVRIWVAGKLPLTNGMIRLEDTAAPGDCATTTADAWRGGSLIYLTGTVTSNNVCGVLTNTTTIIPYNN